MVSISPLARIARPAVRACAVLGVLSLVGCASHESTNCTEIGAPAGIGIEIDASIAQEITDEASLLVSWESTNIDAIAPLYPSTEAVDEGCSGDGQEDSCSATMVPTGGKSGFADIPDLPERSVDVTITLTGLDGELYLSGEIQLTPEPTYPNGPDCPAGGNQAQLFVDAAGNVVPGRN